MDPKRMCGKRPIGFEIRILSNLIKRHIDNTILRKSGETITGVHGRVLGYLYRNTDKDIFQKNLEEEFSIRRSTATAILQLMEKNQYIIRKPVEYDARLKKLELTSKGTELHLKIIKDIDQFEEQLISGISQEELDMFFTTIEKLKANIDKGY